MKRFVILFYLILLMTITCFSQNILINENNDTIVLVTANQLKETNLIFIEHQKLLIENQLLNKQLSNYQYSNNILLQTDSIRLTQLRNYKELVQSYNNEITQLNLELRKKDNTLLIWKVGGITVSISLLIWLLFK